MNEKSLAIPAIKRDMESWKQTLFPLTRPSTWSQNIDWKLFCQKHGPSIIKWWKLAAQAKAAKNRTKSKSKKEKKKTRPALNSKREEEGGAEEDIKKWLRKAWSYMEQVCWVQYPQSTCLVSSTHQLSLCIFSASAVSSVIQPSATTEEKKRKSNFGMKLPNKDYATTKMRNTTAKIEWIPHKHCHTKKSKFRTNLTWVPVRSIMLNRPGKTSYPSQKATWTQHCVILNWESLLPYHWLIGISNQIQKRLQDSKTIQPPVCFADKKDTWGQRSMANFEVTKRQWSE